MNVLVCGGRGYTDLDSIGRVIDGLDRARDVVIHGGGIGLDRVAAETAQAYGIHTARVDAFWDLHGKSAGPMRNAAMLRLHPDKVIAFPGGRGTENCVKQAEALGIPVERIKV